MASKRIIITGILGQDGSLLAEQLYKKGHKIYGIAKPSSNPQRIKWIEDLIPGITIYTNYILYPDVLRDIIQEVKPHEIYNFCGHSNVFNPFDNIDDIFELNAKLPQTFLQIIKEVDKSIKFFQASSSLTFGNDPTGIQNENTSANPIYPYGAAKLYADNLIKMFRKEYGMFCCSGIFFAHESERRGENFFSRKMAIASANVKAGNQKIISVGNLEAYRDFGYAPDYMEAVELMMNAPEPKDYVIGTGNVITMMDYAKKCFEYVGLDYTEHITVDQKLYRKNDTKILKADISEITKDLGWKPKHSIDDIVKIMVDHELNKLKS